MKGRLWRKGIEEHAVNVGVEASAHDGHNLSQVQFIVQLDVLRVTILS